MSKKSPKLLKLDFGCGLAKKQGFVGVDIDAASKPDILLDLRKAWPWKAGSVGEVHCSLMLQYFTGEERITFFNKLYDVMAIGAQATVIVPYGQSNHATMDPLVCWPPMTEQSFLFWNKEWRVKNQVPARGIECDFDFSYGFGFQNGWHMKAEEARQFALVQYINTVAILSVTMTRRDA